MGAVNIRSYKYVTWEQRKTLEELYGAGVPIAEISQALGIHQATLYRELKRGGAEKPGDTYSATRAQYTLKGNFKRRGRKSA